jgi:hypothetical protein
VSCGPANPRGSLEQGHGNGARITIIRQHRGTLGRAWQGTIGSTVFENLNSADGQLPEPHHVRRGQIRPRSPTIRSHAQRFG